MITPQPQSNQFPVTVKAKSNTYQLLYHGQEICKGSASLCYGRKANLLRTEKHNYTEKYFEVKPI